ncbi:MAG: EAL domain-containing protein [Gammaproteobacteria bacterium]|nr:EAL domain-containing protein [Gammaproteobacteria bacterium]
MRKAGKNRVIETVSADVFRTRFRNLIIAAWVGPPIVGLSFLLYIRMFTGEQMIAILMAPLENLFIVGSLVAAVLYFNHFIQPVVNMLADQDKSVSTTAISRMQRFPFDFWLIFMIYLLVAPYTVMLAAEWYTDFVATPVDWFRIHLVALIVSIIVGLPIFFKILDEFGKVMGPIGLERPHVTIKVKVFLIGALMPLLIDTMLVQYYWTRTGFFNYETLMVWFVLELLAIAGSIIFVRSFSQSLRPLQSLTGYVRNIEELNIDTLMPQSTDELGVLATSYRSLFENWRTDNEILKINARILRSSGSAVSLFEAVDDIIKVCEDVIDDDMVFLIIPSKTGDNLIGVAQSDGPYKPEGYYQLSLEEPSIAGWIFNQGEAALIDDVSKDERSSSRMIEEYGTQSLMGVPLKYGEEVIGVLLSISKTLHKYTPRDQKLMEGIAREVAIAIRTYQLHQDRVAAELAQKDNEELLQLLMSATEEGIYGVDIDGLCIFINPAGLKLLAYDSEDELLGKSIHEMIHHTFPDGSPYPKEQCQVKLATQNGKSGHSDVEYHWRKDGTSFATEYWSHPIYKDGKIVGTVVTFIDITDRVVAMEKLKYQAQVIAQIKNSVVATDLDGIVTSWNKGAEDLFGHTEKFMLGRHISYVYPEEELPALNNAISILKVQDAHESEVIMRRKDGTDFSANLSLSMLYDENDRPAGMIGSSVDITEQKASQAAIWHQAHHDKLTGLPNRWLLQDRITQNIAIVNRECRQGAVMFLDLDRFKKINDTLGHQFGDEVLLVVTRRLSELVREGDTLARVGGDEFVMLLANLHDIDEAADIAQRVLHEVKQPFYVQGREVRLGGSIGIAGYPQHGADSDTLLKHADFAMYHAKENGGDNYRFYTAEIHQRASTRYQLEHELHHAIEDDELEVYYQPQYDIATGNIVGLEALSRWNSKKLGPVMPDEFISVAEETGLIISLGQNILDRVINDICSWKRTGIELPTVAINLSARQIYSDETLAMIREVMLGRELQDVALEFEITESTLMDNPQLAEIKIKEMKDLGASIALDDFGTGYSSLAYLKRFPVDVLKIDRTFISDLEDDIDDREIVETIIGMAKNLGISVIAEGIESKIQADFLLAHGCHIAQGYYYSMPLAINDCTKLLTK